MVQYIGHRVKVLKYVGSAKNDREIHALQKLAAKWIDEQMTQASLFPEENQEVLFVDKSEYIAVTHNFAYQFFLRCIHECKLSQLPPLLIEKRKLLLGIKGYCTDLIEGSLSSNEVIERYHQLWHIEQSFIKSMILSDYMSLFAL